MKEPKQTIVLMSRGSRLNALFVEMCRTLSAQSHVVVLTTPDPKESSLEAKTFQGLPNTTVYDFANEIRSYYQEARVKPDFASLLSFVEQEIGLTAYQSASNYHLYRRFSLDYYKHWDQGFYEEEEEIFEQFLGSYLFFNALIERHSPSLFFCETNDLIPHRVAAALSAKRNIFTVMNAFVSSFGKGRAFLAAGTNRRNILLEHYYRNPGLIQKSSFELADQVLEEYKKGTRKEASQISWLRARSSKFLSRYPLKRWNVLLERNWFQIARKEATRLKNLRWLEANCHNELPQSPYILFPLQHQPEATTLLSAPQWVDQDKISEQLAMNAPAGIKIVIKENPRTFGLRGKEYFKSLATFKNVWLLHPSFENSKAIENASIILAITGTVGIEGIFSGKRVAVLGSTYYSFFPGIRRLSSPQDLIQCMDDKDWDPNNYVNERRTFAAAFIESSFYAGMGQAGSPWPRGEEAGKNYAGALTSFIESVRRFGLRLDQFELAR